MIKNSNHTPRWAKIEYCCIPLCSDTAFVKGKISTPEQTAQFLEIEVEQVPYPTPLCKKHYHKVYDALQHKQTHCCACGVFLRCAPIRVCPNATMIKKTGFDGNITNGDRVCTACYKSHLQILKEVPSSTDRDLNELIDGLKGCTLGQHNIRSTEDVINTAMHHTTIYVGELLLYSKNHSSCHLYMESFTPF